MEKRYYNTDEKVRMLKKFPRINTRLAWDVAFILDGMDFDQLSELAKIIKTISRGKQ